MSQFKRTEIPPEVDPETFRPVILGRRSIRVFDGTPVPESIVRECLDLALLSPTSSNLQAWEFYWIRSAEKKARMVKACFNQSAARTAAEIIVAVARRKTWKRNRKLLLEQLAPLEPPKIVLDYYEKAVPFVYGLGFLGLFGFIKFFIYFFVGLFRPTPRGPVSKADMRVWSVKTTALACQTLMLSFRAYGYDTCPMEGLDERRVKRILGLSRDAEVVMGIGVGRRVAEQVYGPRMRLDKNLFIKEI